jgi:hypothetical protein
MLFATVRQGEDLDPSDCSLGAIDDQQKLPKHRAVVEI